MTRKKAVSKVLELKGFTKEQLEAEVKKANDKLSLEKASFDCLEETFKKTVKDFNSRQNNGPLHIREMDLFYDYLSHLNKQIEKQREIVHRGLDELEIKKKALLGAYKEKRLLEILRDKISREETAKILKVEQKEADFNFISRKSRG